MKIWKSLNDFMWIAFYFNQVYIIHVHALNARIFNVSHVILPFLPIFQTAWSKAADILIHAYFHKNLKIQKMIFRLTNEGIYSSQTALSIFENY
jgi:hypothetical protein